MIPEWSEPLLSALFFYGSVVGICELSRRAVHQLTSKKFNIQRFLLEVIGTVQLVTCIFENIVVGTSYGLTVWFIFSTIIGIIYGLTCKNVVGSPLALIEEFYYSKISVGTFVPLLLAECIAGNLAVRFAHSLWYYTATYSKVHLEHFVATQKDCKLNYHIDFMYVFAWEIIGTFLIRAAFPRIPGSIAKYAIPAYISSLFAFAIMYVGDSGLDPLVASSLFFGCFGLSFQYFMLLYWIAPLIGWMLAAQLDRPSLFKPKTSSKEAPKKNKKKKNE